jgi:hypothetical protein
VLSFSRGKDERMYRASDLGASPEAAPLVEAEAGLTSDGPAPEADPCHARSRCTLQPLNGANLGIGSSLCWSLINPIMSLNWFATV